MHRAWDATDRPPADRTSVERFDTLSRQGGRFDRDVTEHDATRELRASQSDTAANVTAEAASGWMEDQCR